MSNENLMGVYVSYDENGMITEINSINSRTRGENEVQYFIDKKVFGFSSAALTLPDSYRVLSHLQEVLKDKTVQQQIREFTEPYLFLTFEEFNNLTLGKLYFRVNLETKQIEECELYELAPEEIIIQIKKFEVQQFYMIELSNRIKYEFEEGVENSVQFNLPSQTKLLVLNERAKNLVENNSSEKLIFRDGENNIRHLTGQEFLDMFNHVNDHAEELAIVKWNVKDKILEKSGNKKDLYETDVAKLWNEEKEEIIT